MTTLKTYDRNAKEAAGIKPVLHQSRWRKSRLAPGAFVEDTSGSQGGRGFGTVVGITAEELAVLWSVEPATQRSHEFNPLAFEEDIYVPTGLSRDEIDKFVAEGRPPEPDPENDAWVIRQLKRMAGLK